jgi:hypothetical protein
MDPDEPQDEGESCQVGVGKFLLYCGVTFTILFSYLKTPQNPGVPHPTCLSSTVEKKKKKKKDV